MYISSQSHPSDISSQKGVQQSFNVKFYNQGPVVRRGVSHVVVVLLFYVHGKHLRSCWDGQLTEPHFSWAGLDLLSG